MKTATLLLGLASAAAAAPAAPVAPHHPLCHTDGSPACGNIGQAGRPTPTPSAHAAMAVLSTVAAAPIAVVRLVPVATQLLVATSAQLVYASGTPLRTADDNIACGNVMSKGGPRCHKPAVQTAAVDGEEP